MKKTLLNVLSSFALVLFALAAQAQSNLVLTAVFDGNLPGQLPKGIELYVINDIADMSIYGVGSANNGGGTDGQEFTFPADSYTAGSYIYVASEAPGFTSFFGFAPNYTNNALNVNGDDAIELFMNGEPVDVYGEIEYETFDGVWDYADGWAYRNSGTGPDGTTFIAENWSISGSGVFTGIATNSESTFPMPVGTYTADGVQVPAVSFDATAMAVLEGDGAVEIVVLITNPDADNPTSVEVVLVGGTAVNGVDFNFSSPELVTFPAGSSEPQTVLIDLIDNIEEDGEKTIQLSLQNPDNNAIVGVGTLLITIEDDDAVIPYFEIDVLRANDEAGVPELIGTQCEIRGRVHGVNTNPAGLQFTLIDPTNGIGVFRQMGDVGYTVQEGDSVHVIGTVDFFNGLTQVSADTVMLMATGLEPYAPQVVTELSEETESNVVMLNCVMLLDTAQWTGEGPGFNVDVNDGTNVHRVRIYAAVDLYGAPAPTGFLHVSGIGGQFDSSAPYDSGYQLSPRYSADIVVAGEECFTGVNSKAMINLLVYPNPATNELRVAGDQNISEIRIIDHSGKVVRYISDVGAQEKHIDISDLAKNAYQIEIRTEAGRVVKSFIKH